MHNFVNQCHRNKFNKKKTVRANVIYLQYDNKTIVLKTLAKAVFQTKSLSKVRAEQFVCFLLEYHPELFKVSLAFCLGTFSIKLFLLSKKASNSLSK